MLRRVERKAECVLGSVGIMEKNIALLLCGCRKQGFLAFASLLAAPGLALAPAC